MKAIAVVLALGACAPNPKASTQVLPSPVAIVSDTSVVLTSAAVAGCYDLSRTGWYSVPARRLGETAWPDTVVARADSLYLRDREPPRHVRLLLDPARSGRAQGWLALEPEGPDRGAHRGLGERYWRVFGATVQAVWTNGFIGVHLTVQPTAFGLEGVAVAFSDVVGPFPIPAARVTLLRTRCRD